MKCPMGIIFHLISFEFRKYVNGFTFQINGYSCEKHRMIIKVYIIKHNTKVKYLETLPSYQKNAVLILVSIDVY